MILKLIHFFIIVAREFLFTKNVKTKISTLLYVTATWRRWFFFWGKITKIIVVSFVERRFGDLAVWRRVKKGVQHNIGIAKLPNRQIGTLPTINPYLNS